MARSILLLLLLCFSLPVLSQRMHRHGRHRLPERYKKPFIPRKNAITGAVNVGVMLRCVAVRAGLEYERFLGKDGDISATLALDGFIGGTVNSIGKAHADDDRMGVNGFYAALTGTT